MTGDGARVRDVAIAFESCTDEAETSSDLECSFCTIADVDAAAEIAADADDKAGKAADTALCSDDDGDTLGDNACAFMAVSLAARGRAPLPFSLSPALRGSPTKPPCFEGDFFFFAEE